MTKATKDFRFDKHYNVSFYVCKKWPRNKTRIYIIKSGVCLPVCLSVCRFVCLSLLWKMLTSPSVLKLLDSQGYLWLPYDLAEVIKLIEPKEYFFFKKILYVTPSGLLSFLPNIVIPSKLLSFWIAPNFLPYPKGKKIGWQSRPYLQVFSKLLQSLKIFW